MESAPCSTHSLSLPTLALADGGRLSAEVSFSTSPGKPPSRQLSIYSFSGTRRLSGAAVLDPRDLRGAYDSHQVTNARKLSCGATARQRHNP